MCVPSSGVVQGIGSLYGGKGNISEENRKAKKNDANAEKNNINTSNEAENVSKAASNAK